MNRDKKFEPFNQYVKLQYDVCNNALALYYIFATMI